MSVKIPVYVHQIISDENTIFLILFHPLNSLKSTGFSFDLSSISFHRIKSQIWPPFHQPLQHGKYERLLSLIIPIMLCGSTKSLLFSIPILWWASLFLSVVVNIFKVVQEFSLVKSIQIIKMAGQWQSLSYLHQPYFGTISFTLDYGSEIWSRSLASSWYQIFIHLLITCAWSERRNAQYQKGKWLGQCIYAKDQRSKRLQSQFFLMMRSSYIWPLRAFQESLVHSVLPFELEIDHLILKNFKHYYLTKGISYTPKCSKTPTKVIIWTAQRSLHGGYDCFYEIRKLSSRSISI